jgi:hypothetical protein
MHLQSTQLTDMLHTLLFTVLAFLAVPLPQSRPDFTGTWILDEAKTAARSPQGGRASAGAASAGTAALPVGEIVIRHTAESLIVERQPFDTVIREVFALDGSPSTNKSGAMTRMSKTRWEGRTLVTEGTLSQVTSQGYAAWTFKQSRTLDASGAMVVQSRQVATDGTVFEATQVFVKKT